MNTEQSDQRYSEPESCILQTIPSSANTSTKVSFISLGSVFVVLKLGIREVYNLIDHA
jgi:hypothetical protein